MTNTATVDVGDRAHAAETIAVHYPLNAIAGAATALANQIAYRLRHKTMGQSTEAKMLATLCGLKA